MSFATGPCYLQRTIWNVLDIVQGLVAQTRLIHIADTEDEIVQRIPTYMSTPQEPPAESGPYARREELARLAGEVKTMEARVNGRASAESARIDGEIKTRTAEHSTELRAVLEAVNALGAEMKAMTVETILEMKNMEERLRGEIRLLKWGIGLILAFVVPTFVRVFTPQIGALLFGI